MKKTVVIGFLGTQLDYGGRGATRWAKWRPTVALCQQDDLPIDRLHLLHDERSRGLAERVSLDIAEVSPRTEVCRVEIGLRDAWDFEEMYTTLHDFARAYPFSTDDEDYLIHITTGTHVAQICWFLLAETRYLPARLLQMSPPRKGGEEAAARVGSYALIDLDLSRYDKIAQRFRHEQADTQVFLKSGIATRNADFNAMIERLERVAGRSRAPLLLVGPTGAGKSFLARRVYELKRQKQRIGGRFVEVNCATLRGDAAMSALFGHVRGAFTGAQGERIGLLRAADGGLLFLDEIGELGLDEQAMLLKAVEERRFFPLGSDRESGSDFQLIAGTNRDLRRGVREGRFREDLLARINLWTFELPGLSARLEDIEPNLDFELERHAREQGRQVRFNAEARSVYLAFACSPQALWRGNFRELSASLTRLATLAEAGRINQADVRDEIARLRRAWADEQSDDLAEQFLGAGADELDLFERSQLNCVLEVCRRSASLSEAGRKLFAVSRLQKRQANDADRLRKYLARFGLDWAALAASRPAA
ncbi:MAG TPA: RNA repair transcriptional activator RtcR [Accumulibacter sp.]|uniref:RNA repair transcriptional activator RtcR n=1 Tax=Accumulibacter sp. TaxID=2053492 RepID=UPI002C9F04D9|nr:RNA repair transcriptional activator RtcR [Accumulibacter sp.]HNN84490.1 RNA repair transcriptional activator RtcR [Accumulibacter sp.]